MKKALSLILVLVLLLTLCACGKGGDQTDATGGTTGESVNDQTEGSTGSTQATSGNEGTTATTGDTNDETGATEPAGTTATQPAGTTATEPAGTTATEPAPTTCSHTFSEATCAAPKTCTKCGVTEGGKGDHTLTATCTVCGQVNEGYCPLSSRYWNYEVAEGDEITYGSYYFFTDGVNVNVEVFYSFYKTLKAVAAEQNTTEEALREEYAPMEMIKIINGVEYVYNGWGMDNWSRRRYTEEDGVITVTFQSLDWGENDEEIWTVMETVVMHRTGLDELIVISSNHRETPVGLKLVCQPIED